MSRNMSQMLYSCTHSVYVMAYNNDYPTSTLISQVIVNLWCDSLIQVELLIFAYIINWLRRRFHDVHSTFESLFHVTVKKFPIVVICFTNMKDIFLNKFTYLVLISKRCIISSVLCYQASF